MMRVVSTTRIFYEVNVDNVKRYAYNKIYVSKRIFFEMENEKFTSYSETCKSRQGAEHNSVYLLSRRYLRLCCVAAVRN